MFSLIGDFWGMGILTFRMPQTWSSFLAKSAGWSLSPSPAGLTSIPLMQVLCISCCFNLILLLQLWRWLSCEGVCHFQGIPWSVKVESSLRISLSTRWNDLATDNRLPLGQFWGRELRWLQERRCCGATARNIFLKQNVWGWWRWRWGCRRVCVKVRWYIDAYPPWVRWW